MVRPLINTFRFYMFDSYRRWGFSCSSHDYQNVYCLMRRARPVKTNRRLTRRQKLQQGPTVTAACARGSLASRAAPDAVQLCQLEARRLLRELGTLSPRGTRPRAPVGSRSTSSLATQNARPARRALLRRETRMFSSGSSMKAGIFVSTQRGVHGAWRMSRVHSSESAYCRASIVSKRLQPCLSRLWNWAKKARIGLPGRARAYSSKTCSNCFSRLACCSAESCCSGAMSGGVTSSVRCFFGGGLGCGAGLHFELCPLKRFAQLRKSSAGDYLHNASARWRKALQGQLAFARICRASGM